MLAGRPASQLVTVVCFGLCAPASPPCRLQSATVLVATSEGVSQSSSSVWYGPSELKNQPPSSILHPTGTRQAVRAGVESSLSLTGRQAVGRHLRPRHPPPAASCRRCRVLTAVRSQRCTPNHQVPQT